MPVPGATRAGNWPPPQRDGPLLENGAIVVALAVAPTANASGRFAGRGVGGRGGPAVPGGEDGQDARGPQRLQIWLELEVAGCELCAPGGVDDVRRVVRRGIPVGVEQPLEGQVHAAVGAGPRVVEDPCGDEPRARRHADAAAGDDHARDLGAVAVHVHGSAVLPEGVEPAVAAPAVAAGELRMRQVDTGVEGRDRDPAAVDAPAPEHGGARRGDAGLPRDGIGGPDRQFRVGLHPAHVRAGSQRCESGGIGRHRHGVRDPQRADVPRVTRAPQLLELGENGCLRAPAVALQAPGHLVGRHGRRGGDRSVEMDDHRPHGRSGLRGRRDQRGAGERHQEKLAHQAGARQARTEVRAPACAGARACRPRS